MKIVSVNLGKGVNDNVVVDDDDEIVVVKKEVVEEEDQEDQSFNSMEQFVNLTHLPNNPPTLSPSTPSPSSMVKQKKPDGILDMMKKKKKPPGFGSNHAVPDHASKFAVNCPDGVKSATMIRAEEIQSSLGTEFPSFLKLMVRSHVSGCFWMGLSRPFVKLHLPKEDNIIILENESGQTFDTKFIADKHALSGGWRNFAIVQKLLMGDVLIFQLIEANKFKVYIIRAKDFGEVEGDLGHLNLDAHIKQDDADDRGTIALKNKKRKQSRPSALVQKKKNKTGLPKYVSRRVQPLEQSEHHDDSQDSDVLAGSESSNSSVAFGDIKSYEDFKIALNKLDIDSELPEHIRTKYYDICRSKNSFLHANLLPGLNSSLVTGIIIETVNIVDAMRGCNLSTSLEEFAIWDKTLKSFELLGMNVGFLHARLCRLLTLAFESEDAVKAKRYIDAKTHCARAEKEIRDLEATIAQLKEVTENLNSDIETLKSEAESYTLKFQEEVDTPW